jgi:DNA-binding MarR family transcriptional regulator
MTRGGKQKGGAPQQALELRLLIQRFVRDWGLLDQDLTPCGQPVSTSHGHALMFLLERAGHARLPTQKELALELGIDKSNVARLCQRMEAAGHVVQSRCEDDARARNLRLTTKGLKVAKEVSDASELRFVELYEGIPSSQRTQLLSALRSLVDAARELRS